MLAKNPNPYVFTKKAVYMQRIADAVGNGYVRYVSGTIDVKKAAFFSSKMNFLYACFQTSLEQFRQRKAGICGARLLFYLPAQGESLQWMLLATYGDWLTPESGRENWKDATENRIVVDGYELVRHTRLQKQPAIGEIAKNSPKKGTGKPSWTWRFQPTHYVELRRKAIHAIRSHHDEELKRLIDTAWRSPGFAGVRKDVKKLKDLIRGEWGRTRISDPPAIPGQMGWVRRLPNRGISLNQLTKELQNADR